MAVVIFYRFRLYGTKNTRAIGFRYGAHAGKNSTAICNVQISHDMCLDVGVHIHLYAYSFVSDRIMATGLGVL